MLAKQVREPKLAYARAMNGNERHGRAARGGSRISPPKPSIVRRGLKYLILALGTARGILEEKRDLGTPPMQRGHPTARLPRRRQPAQKQRGRLEDAVLQPALVRPTPTRNTSVDGQPPVHAPANLAVRLRPRLLPRPRWTAGARSKRWLPRSSETLASARRTTKKSTSHDASASDRSLILQDEGNWPNSFFVISPSRAPRSIFSFRNWSNSRRDQAENGGPRRPFPERTGNCVVVESKRGRFPERPNTETEERCATDKSVAGVNTQTVVSPNEPNSFSVAEADSPSGASRRQNKRRR